MRYAALLFGVALAAQESHFDVRSRLVLVPVTVTDAKGRSINGLEPADFQVLDNGRPQKITVDTIDTGVAPIALVVAVQSSAISTAVLEKVKKVASMVQPLITGERGCAGLLSFSGRVTWLEECTGDADALVGAFRKLRPGEEKEARMLDAVTAAVEHLRKRPNARRVLLLVSETRDRTSETDLETVTMAAQSAAVTIYAATYSAFATAFTSQSSRAKPTGPKRPPTGNETLGTLNGAPASKYNPKIPPPEHRVDFIGLMGELARLGGTNTTQALAASTGGTTFPFTRQKGLEDTIEKLSAELHTQYVLSFAPQTPAPGYHSLEVRVARPGDIRIRTRPGYWSAEEVR